MPSVGGRRLSGSFQAVTFATRGRCEGLGPSQDWSAKTRCSERSRQWRRRPVRHPGSTPRRSGELLSCGVQVEVIRFAVGPGAPDDAQPSASQDADGLRMTGSLACMRLPGWSPDHRASAPAHAGRGSSRTAARARASDGHRCAADQPAGRRPRHRFWRAVAAVARPAGLDRVGMDREDVMPGLDECVDDQARRPLDGDAHACAETAQPAHQFGQASALVGDLETIEHAASSVDRAHSVCMHGPVRAGEYLGAALATHRSSAGSAPQIWATGRHGRVIPSKAGCSSLAASNGRCRH